MKIYVGHYKDGFDTVTVNDTPLDPRFDLMIHSPTGFSWGYGGSGPAQLALAILADCVGPDDAIRFHQDFKWQVVCYWPLDQPWTINETDIQTWITKAKSEREKTVTQVHIDHDNPSID